MTKRLLQVAFVYKELEGAFVYTEPEGSTVRSDYTVTIPMKLQKMNFPVTLWFHYWNNMKRERQIWLLAVM